MNFFAKRLLLISLLLIVIISLSSCTKEPEENPEDNVLSIIISPFKGEKYMNALIEHFPDITFEVEDYSGSNMSLYLSELVSRGMVGDLVFYTTFLNSSYVKDNLVDISGYDFVTNFDKGILSTLDVDGAIYQIPGPVTCRSFVVNKTLFEEKGWHIPTNFDEIVEVAKIIAQDESGIVPIGIGLAGAGYPYTLVSSHAQAGFMSTPEGKKLEKAYLAGEASIKEIYDEGLEMVGKLCDAGAFDTELFAGTWDIPASVFKNRTVAMGYLLNINQQLAELLNGQEGEDEFVLLPFFGQHDGQKAIIIGASSLWGINKRLQEKGNEKKLANAIRVLEYLSSEEGQLAIRDSESQIPALRGLKTDSVLPFMKEYWNTNQDAVKAFFIYTGYEDAMVEAAGAITDAMKNKSSKGMSQRFIETHDKLHKEALEISSSSSSSSGSFAKAEQTLSIKQTREICLNAIADVAQTDVVIATEAARKDGVNNTSGLAGLIFSGEINENLINVLLGNLKDTIVYYTLSGAELKALIMRGKTWYDAENNPVIFPYEHLLGLSVTKDENGNTTSIKYHDQDLEKVESLCVGVMVTDVPNGFNETHTPTDTGVNNVEAIKRYLLNHPVIKAN